MKLISLPNASDLKQVARWHEQQAKRKKDRRDKERHQKLAAELKARAREQL